MHNLSCAIEALYDELEKSGAFNNRLVQYLTYRVRVESARASNDTDSVTFWSGKIDQMLTEERQAAADDAFAAYQFGEGIQVVESDNWNRDDPNDWTKVVYVQYADDPAVADSHKVSFHVRFVGKGSKIDEVYALEMEKGGDIGQPGTEISAPPSLPTSEANLTVSLDGGVSYQPARAGVRIAFHDLPIPGEDQNGEMHLNVTHEGLIIDVWATRDEPLDHNIGTSSEMTTDIVSRLVDDNA